MFSQGIIHNLFFSIGVIGLILILNGLMGMLGSSDEPDLQSTGSSLFVAFLGLVLTTLGMGVAYCVYDPLAQLEYNTADSKARLKAIMESN